MSSAIILINGTSSTGKTSTARALQKIFPSPLIYLGLDLWIRETLCERFWEPALRLEDIRQDPEARLGTHFLLPNTPENPSPWPIVGSGPVSDDAIYAMYQTAVDFYQRGYWVVIDHVFLTQAWYQHFLEATQKCHRFLFKFTCDLELLTQREKQRGNRMPNVYKGLLDIIHQGVNYDATVDTSRITPLAAAEEILHYPNLNQLLAK